METTLIVNRAGRRRKNHLPLYTDDDGHDLSDLGIGTSSTKSSLSEDCDTHSLAVSIIIYRRLTSAVLVETIWLSGGVLQDVV